jgi:hypothetical protein
MEIKAGQTYRHYKGGVYQIVTVAMNNQTDELYPCVVYQDITDPEKVWVQSLERFSGTEEFQGNTVQRFTLVN